jgi:hypothetical protein
VFYSDFEHKLATTWALPNSHTICYGMPWRKNGCTEKCHALMQWVSLYMKCFDSDCMRLCYNALVPRGTCCTLGILGTQSEDSKGVIQRACLHDNRPTTTAPRVIDA